MNELSEIMLTEGVSIDIFFGSRAPCFGDIFRICGEPHPNFPPTGDFGFESVVDLQFSQVDDYFGVRSLADEGNDIIVWLYPLISAKPVHHNPGPFDGIRLDYNVLTNPARFASLYLNCIERLSALGQSTQYRSRKLELGQPPDVGVVRADIDAIVAHWLDKGIVVGSEEALDIDV